MSTEVDRYTTAVMAFRGKYFQLPGDMNNATSFWGDRATGAEACADATIADGTPGTCNGNGDQQIGSTAAPHYYEYVLVWQHLSLAGLIPGSYTGINPTLNVGVNVPIGRFGRGLYWLLYEHAYGRYGNLIHYGSLTGQAWGPVMRPEDAWNIDTKRDDGDPFRGNVRTSNGYAGGTFPTTGCVNTGTRAAVTPVTYDFSATTPTCMVTFFMPF